MLRLSLAAAIAAFCALAPSAQEPASPWRGPLAEGVKQRIEPGVLDALAELEATGSHVDQGRRFDHVRVVVELLPRAGDPTFATSTAKDPVADVAAAVAQRTELFTAGLAARLPADAAAGVRVIDRLTLQYSVVAEVRTPQALLALATLPDVAHVWKDWLRVLYTTQGRALTGSTAAATAGFTGTGVGVAVIDTRFNLLHPELGGSTTLPNSIVKGGSNFSDVGQPIHSTVVNDCYHGTGTASIVRRYAPGVTLYLATVFPNSFDTNIANAINWCVTNRTGMNGGAPIRVISMSFGGGRAFTVQSAGTLPAACTTARSNGLVCLAASGNDGWTDSMGVPAASTDCLSVGAVWDANNAPYAPFAPTNCTDASRLVDERTCYSDSASFLSFYAPSEEVVCAFCGGGTFALGGTSSACPAAAGLTAQLMHAVPSMIGNLSGIRTAFQATGATVTGDTTKRRIDLTAAIASLTLAPAPCVETSLGTNLQLDDDENATNVALGFTFPYAGATTTAVDVSSNGFIFPFTGSALDTRCCTANGPTLVAGRPTIAPLWTDIDPSPVGAGDVYFNALPGRAVITWLNVESFNGTTTYTVQCTLYPTGAITFWYSSTVQVLRNTTVGISQGNGAANPGGTDLSVALPVNTGTQRTIYQDFGAGGFDLQNRFIRFAPNGMGGYVVASGCTAGGVNAYGAGCPIGLPLTLAAAPGSLPRIGQSFSLVTSNRPAPISLGALHVAGVSQNVPLDLIGMTGCWLLTTADASISTVLSASPIVISIANDPGMVGAAAYMQVLALASGVNPLGVTTSNGVQLVVGF